MDMPGMGGMAMATTSATTNDNSTANSGGNNADSSYMMMPYLHVMPSDYLLFQPLLLVQAWQVGTACVSTFLLAMLFESLKMFRHLVVFRAEAKRVSSQKFTQIFAHGDTMVEVIETVDQTKKEVSVKIELPPYRHAISSTYHIIDSLLYFVQVVLSFLIMLIVMTYSVWLLLAVSVGMGVGYFVFGCVHQGIPIIGMPDGHHGV